MMRIASQIEQIECEADDADEQGDVSSRTEYHHAVVHINHTYPHKYDIFDLFTVLSTLPSGRALILFHIHSGYV